MNEKACSKCKRVLPAAMFNRANWLASGLRSDCKDCYRITKAAIYAAKPRTEQTTRQRTNKALAANGLRRCKICEAVKPLTEEHFGKSRWWMVSCRECDRERMRKWANDNHERYRANAAAGWAKRRADKGKRTIPLSPGHRQWMKEIYAECRRRNQNNPAAWHVDHIVPLNGKLVSGLHVPWNLQIIPGSENVRKSNRVTENSSSDAVTAAERSSNSIRMMTGTI